MIDGEQQLKDNDQKRKGWQVTKIDQIPPGYHTLTWRYTKLNIIPFTEFMESEIESITVRGRHSNRLTQCYPCNLGHSSPGSGKCKLCPENSYFYVSEENSEYYCAKCPEGYFSAEGSVGVVSCQRKRACDEGDLDIHHSKCEDGQRTLTFTWEDVSGDG